MEKSLDYKGRWRNHTVAFRVSDEEARLLNDLVALSGLTKQDYITRRLLCQDVLVQGNPRVYKALKNQMTAIHEELKRMENEVLELYKAKLKEKIAIYNNLLESMIDTFSEEQYSEVLEAKRTVLFCLDLLTEVEREIYSKEKKD